MDTEAEPMHPEVVDDEPEVYNQARAVARLLVGGSFTCTGWLVGCEGHLITNNHCIANTVAAVNTDYEFMAEGEFCTTDCFGSLLCPGTVEATSATLIQTDVALDYSLLRLPTNLVSSYGFMTLRPDGPTPPWPA